MSQSPAVLKLLPGVRSDEEDMRQDSIEFGWARVATRERPTARTAKGNRIDAATIAHAPANAVIDEAFAGFDTIDRASTADATTNDGPRLMSKSLVANLAAQLEALDRQREQLAELLRSIDDASIAGN